MAAQVIRNALEAERQGFAAFVIGHFQEPGLHESKAVVARPVMKQCLVMAHSRALLPERAARRSMKKRPARSSFG